jgi:hypothetical protein
MSMQLLIVRIIALFSMIRKTPRLMLHPILILIFAYPTFLICTQFTKGVVGATLMVFP